jgi:peptidoglycan/LPS O-acetylase OafA/YrhL
MMNARAHGGAVHFPGLNALRFIAALFVFLFHVEQGKQFAGLPNIFDTPYLGPAWYRFGELGVRFFFVLSGFLITFLLLREYRQTGKVDVGRFYIRRALRIWPVYFLLVFLGFAIGPLLGIFDFPIWSPVRDEFFWKRLTYFLAFSPQLLEPMNLIKGASFAGVLWSVGLEEHFYFLWPWLLRAAKANVLVLGAVILALSFAFDTDTAGNFLGPLTIFFRMENFSSMAIGAIGGWLVHRNSRLLKLLYPRYAQILALGILGATLIVNPQLLVASKLLNGTLFLAVILIVTSTPNPVLRLEQPWLEGLGEYSYSFYCFHWMMIAPTLNAVVKSGLIVESLLFQVIVYGIPFGLTILFSALSYRFLEGPFLRLKSAFAVVPSASRGLEGALETFEERANLQTR